jgi:ECF transporter S component (folate family)
MALSVVLSLIRPAMPPPFGGWLRLDAFPLILSGFILGPGGGFFVGALSDLPNYLFHSTGGFFPGFTLTRALTGMLPALFLNRARPSFLRLLVVIAAGQAITKLWLFPTMMYFYAHHPIRVTAGRELLTQCLHVPLYAWLAIPILRAWHRHSHGAAND